MQRLVYSPKVYAYVKSAKGDLTDLSPYITSGTVDRKVNAVSTAKLSLRNPNMIFTQPGNPTFTPMDPVTIYLQRLHNRPVRVFTGFLDKTPYYQMYPGTVTLECSCTLKKLQYTYFDPALPYTRDFMYQFGWGPDPQNPDGALRNPNALNDNVKFDPKKSQGSLSDLLYGTVIDIGHWDKKNVFVEKLPENMVQRMLNLYKQFDAEADSTHKELQDLFKKIVGTASLGQGGGGGTQGTANVPSAGVLTYDQIAQVAYAAGFRGRDLCTATAIPDKESSRNASVGCNSSNHCGLWQITAGDSGFDAHELQDVNNNAKAAFALYSGRGGPKVSYAQRWADWLPYSGPYNDAPGSAACKAATQVEQNPPGSPSTLNRNATAA